MATHEVYLSFQWLYATLSGDATLQGYAPGGVWRAEAPPSTATPYVIIAHQPSSGGDKIVFGGARAYSDMLFQVFAAGPAKSTQAIANAAARIDSLITTTQIAVTGGTIMASFRAQPVEEDPLIDGELWSNLGGVYQIMAKGS